MMKTYLKFSAFRVRRTVFAGAVAAAIMLSPILLSPVLLLASPAQAQDLTREVDRLKRDLADLQRFVYNGQTGPAPSAPSASVTDDGSLTGDVAARFQVKIQELERRLRETNGKTEEVGFKLRQLEQRLDTALADIEFRLTRLEGGNTAAPGQTSALSSGGAPLSGQASGQTSGAQPLIPVPNQAQAGQSQGTTVITSQGAQDGTTGPVGGTLGTLIVDAQGNVVGGKPSQGATVGSTPLANQGAAPSTPPPAPSTVQTLGPVDGSDIASASSAATGDLPTEPQALYDFSLGLMRQGDYPGAEGALRVFLDKYPENDLVGAALYWLGETFYVRDNYRDAAFSFVDVYSKHPKSSKAPDSLLKLGMSLYALGSKAEACSAFNTLRAEYPDARRAVLKLADDRGAQYGC